MHKRCSRDQHAWGLSPVCVGSPAPSTTVTSWIFLNQGYVTGIFPRGTTNFFMWKKYEESFDFIDISLYISRVFWLGCIASLLSAPWARVFMSFMYPSVLGTQASGCLRLLVTEPPNFVHRLRWNIQEISNKISNLRSHWLNIIQAFALYISLIFLFFFFFFFSWPGGHEEWRPGFSLLTKGWK